MPAGKLGVVGRAITSFTRPLFRNHAHPSGSFRPPANSKRSAKPFHHSHAHYSAYHGTPLARLPVGKLGAVGRAITSLACPLFRQPCANPLACSARGQTRSCRSSHYIIHVLIVPPTMCNHLASSARRAAARTTRSSTCCTAMLLPSAAHQARLPAGKL